MLAFLLQLIKFFRNCFAQLDLAYCAASVFKLVFFFTTAKSSLTYIRAKRRSRKCLNPKRLGCLVHSNYSCARIGRDSPKYGFAVVGMTALVIVLHEWVIIAALLVLLPPSWVLQEWAWLGCWSQLCPGHRGSPSLRWDLQYGFNPLWWRFFLFPFLSVHFLDHTYILIGYQPTVDFHAQSFWACVSKLIEDDFELER